MPEYFFNDPDHFDGAAPSFDAWCVGDAQWFQVGASGPRWGAGSGSPEGQKAWPFGSLWSRTDSTATSALYVKQSVTAASTGWILK